MSELSGAKSIGQLPPMHCLLAFEAVARNQQLARAAHELGLSKSALCNSIGLLEHRLRLRLIRRYSPSVELTEAGRQYLAATQAFSHEIRDGLFEESPLARTQLRVSASRALGRLWLGPRLADFTRRQPRIELMVTTTDRMDSVLGDGVDIALRYGGQTPEGSVSVPLLSDRLIAVASPALLRHCAHPVAIAELRRLPLIEHPSLRWVEWLAGTGGSDGVPEPRLTTTDLHFALNAAISGVGVAIVPSLFARPGLDSQRLLRIGEHAVPAKPYHAVISTTQLARAPMQAFLAWLQQQAAGAQPVLSAP